MKKHFWLFSILLSFVLFEVDSVAMTLQKLYSSRFTISSRGIPQISIGLLQNRTSVVLYSNKTIRVKLHQQHKTSSLRLGRKVRIQLLKSQPAEVLFWLSPFKLPIQKKQAWKEEQAKYAFLSTSLRMSQTGSFFSLQGNFVDNRKLIALYKHYTSLEKAKAAQKYWIRQKGLYFSIYKQMLHYPKATFLVTSGHTSRKIRGVLSFYSSRKRQPLFVSLTKNIRRAFVGKLIIAPGANGKISLLNHLPLPLYLQGVLPSEMPASAPIEALKAQAICARNEILAKIGHRHHADPFLFCASTHCQVYKGTKVRHHRTNQAIQATRGMVLWHPESRLADAYYSAVCGGHTEHSHNVWNNYKDPSLFGKSDLHPNQISSFSRSPRWYTSPPRSYCWTVSTQRNRTFRWKVRWSQQQLQALIHRKLPSIGLLKNMIPVKRGVSGRITKLRLIGTKGNKLIFGELRIRRFFGGLKSSMFRIVRKPHHKHGGWVFHGGGWGHGVGMCQWGAISRAKKGQSFRKILKHYFHSTRLLRIYR